MANGCASRNGSHPVWLLVMQDTELEEQACGVKIKEFVVTDGVHKERASSLGLALSSLCKMLGQPAEASGVRMPNRQIGCIGAIRVESRKTKAGEKYEIVTPARLRYRRVVGSVRELVSGTVTAFKEMVWFASYEGPPADPALETDRARNVTVYQERANKGLDLFTGRPLAKVTG